MITSIVRLAADPWSRRQQPFRVPKTLWFDRHPRFTVVVIGIGGTCIAFSRFIYDAFNSLFEPDSDSKPTLDLVMLMHQTHWRKDGERPKSLQEAFEEQKKIREEQRKEKERQARLALRL
ncbi:uncharacterized protein LOC119391937 [Rhipicephalus sanguineus]|uniref:uncharacterized protein LOC119391937 n=1 Tax=Rhipicephalus sanguineus TaxID=34632 RepID=UPI001894A9AA|nr:uncharacterized protein LOC119391937 [Rhipicephalus sanguineus]